MARQVIDTEGKEIVTFMDRVENYIHERTYTVVAFAILIILVAVAVTYAVAIVSIDSKADQSDAFSLIRTTLSKTPAPTNPANEDMSKSTDGSAIINSTFAATQTASSNKFIEDSIKQIKDSKNKYSDYVLLTIAQIYLRQNQKQYALAFLTNISDTGSFGTFKNNLLADLNQPYSVGNSTDLSLLWDYRKALGSDFNSSLSVVNDKRFDDIEKDKFSQLLLGNMVRKQVGTN